MNCTSGLRVGACVLLWVALGTATTGSSEAQAGRTDASTKPIGSWLEELRDPTPGVHNRAVSAVSKMRPVAAETVPGLVALLREEDWTLRHRALMVLGNLGAEAVEASPEILTLLSDENLHVRRMAVSALRRIPAVEREVRLGLVAALLHEDTFVRREARYTLEGLGEDASDVAPQLAVLIEDEDATVREAAFRILVKMGPDAAVPLLVPYLKHGEDVVRGGAAHALAEFGPGAAPALPTLRRMLREPAHRSLAAQTLAGIGPAARPAVPELIPLLDASDPAYYLRPAVARALGAIGPEARDALPSLREALARTDESEASGRYRSALVAAIARIAGPDDPAVAAYARRMGKAISSWNPLTRVEAGRALVGLGPWALPALAALRETLREDDQPKVRGLAAEALGAIGAGAEPALPDLRAAQNDENPRVRKKAARAIEEIERHLAEGMPPPRQATIPPEEIETWKPTLAEDVAALATDRRKAPLRLLERGPEALPALHAALLAPGADPRQRMRILMLLGEFGDARSVGPILESLRARPEEPFVAVDALRALSDIPPSPASVDFAAAILEDPEAPARIQRQALVYFAAHRDPRARDWAERLREDEDVEIRAAALYLAARLGDEGAVEPITELLLRERRTSIHYALLLGLAELVDPIAFEERAAGARGDKREYESALRIARFRSGTAEERSALFSDMLHSRFPQERKLAIRGLLERDALEELDPYLEQWWQVPPQLRAVLHNELRRGGYRIVEEKRRVVVARVASD